MRQFTRSNIRGSSSRYWFECAMVSACSPVFNDCYDNYDVEHKLRKAGVLRDEDETDTETCALVVLFQTQEAGALFIDRLNTYLGQHKRE
jgi:hypothetical protein